MTKKLLQLWWHKVRIALSTAYWPMMLPPPYDATLNLDLSSLTLSLPLLGDHERIDVPEPANFDPVPVSETVTPGESGRRIERDLEKGVTHYRKFSKGARNRSLVDNLITGDDFDEIWTIAADNPLSITGECR